MADREIHEDDRVTYNKRYQDAMGVTVQATVISTHTYKGNLYATIEWDDDGPASVLQGVLARDLVIVADPVPCYQDEIISLQPDTTAAPSGPLGRSCWGTPSISRPVVPYRRPPRIPGILEPRRSRRISPGEGRSWSTKLSRIASCSCAARPARQAPPGRLRGMRRVRVFRGGPDDRDALPAHGSGGRDVSHHGIDPSRRPVGAGSTGRRRRLMVPPPDRTAAAPTPGASGLYHAAERRLRPCDRPGRRHLDG